VTESTLKTAVLVVYDQPTLRESYVAAIKALTPFNAARVSCAEEALREAGRTEFAAFLLDARLPRKANAAPSFSDGHDLLVAVHQGWPRAPILVASVVWTPFLLWSSVRNGAAGVLRDDIDFPELAEAVVRAVRTGTFRARDDERQLEMMDGLNITAADRNILLMKREGLSHQDIADSLSISRHTIRSHFQKLAGKFGVDGENEGAIVRRASELGVLQFP
jgi:DNA-binding NarL/FixJ family response regulator